MPAGARALKLLSIPLNVGVLTALSEEPKSLIDLRRALGMPPQTTLRKYLKELASLSIVEREKTPGFSGTVHFNLTPAGQDLATVSTKLDSWLRQSPSGPIHLGEPAAKQVIQALLGAWSPLIIRALAARPLTLTELDRLIPGLNYPTLERRITASRLAGLIEPVPISGRGTPYRVTAWLRAALLPLLEVARWEHRYLRTTANPLSGRDIEAVFLLTAPPSQIPESCSGLCRLVMEGRGQRAGDLAGAVVEIASGKVVSCVSRLEGPADAWVTGTAGAWYEALLDGTPESLELEGDTGLAFELLSQLAWTIDPSRASMARAKTPPADRRHDMARAKIRQTSIAGKTHARGALAEKF